MTDENIRNLVSPEVLAKVHPRLVEKADADLQKILYMTPKPSSPANQEEQQNQQSSNDFYSPDSHPIQ